jgi:hypothetical protein
MGGSQYILSKANAWLLSLDQKFLLYHDWEIHDIQNILPRLAAIAPYLGD